MWPWNQGRQDKIQDKWRADNKKKTWTITAAWQLQDDESYPWNESSCQETVFYKFHDNVISK